MSVAGTGRTSSITSLLPTRRVRRPITITPPLVLARAATSLASSAADFGWSSWYGWPLASSQAHSRAPISRSGLPSASASRASSASRTVTRPVSRRLTHARSAARAQHRSYATGKEEAPAQAPARASASAMNTAGRPFSLWRPDDDR